MKKVIFLGAGGFAREILDTIDEINKCTEDRIEPIGFVYDEGRKDKGKLIHDIPVLGDISYLQHVDKDEVFLVAAAGRSVWRKKMVEQAKAFGARFLSIVHPSSFISKWASIGEGAIIQSLCHVHPEVRIGMFFSSNRAVGIGHDTIIGDYVHINPSVNIAGGARIGNEVFIGIKATILTSTIGDGAIIGACALITKDVPSNVVAKGIPARYSKMDEKEY